jgi:WD40 repeat protein
MIASGGVDGQIYLLDATNGEVIQTLSGHTSSVEQVLFSPEDDTVASLSSDGSFRLWDIATGDERLVFEHRESLFYMAYSPGGRFVAFSSYTQDPETFVTSSATVWLVDTQDERERSIITLEDGRFVNSLAFSPDSAELLFSASNDEDPENRQTNVWLWDIERDQEIDTWVQEGNPVDVFFTPAGRMYNTMNDIHDANDLLLWDVTENYIQERLTGFRGLTYHVVLNAAGTIMGAASYDGTVRLWDFDGLEEVAVLNHEGGAYGVALSEDGRLLATADDLGNVVLWGVTNASNA